MKIKSFIWGICLLCIGVAIGKGVATSTTTYAAQDNLEW